MEDAQSVYHDEKVFDAGFEWAAEYAGHRDILMICQYQDNWLEMTDSKSYEEILIEDEGPANRVIDGLVNNRKYFDPDKISDGRVVLFMAGVRAGMESIAKRVQVASDCVRRFREYYGDPVELPA